MSLIDNTIIDLNMSSAYLKRKKTIKLLTGFAFMMAMKENNPLGLSRYLGSGKYDQKNSPFMPEFLWSYSLLLVVTLKTARIIIHLHPFINEIIRIR